MDRAAYRVSARVRNNRLLVACERTWPGASLVKVARRVRVPYTTLAGLAAMRKWPRCLACLKEGAWGCGRCTGGWGRTATRMAQAVGLPVEWLFEEELYGEAPQPMELEMDRPALEGAGMLAFPLPPDAAVEAEERRMAVATALDLVHLTAQQRRVLTLRYGVGGDEEGLPVGEVAARMGLSATRIGQVEQKALRRLRHPRIARALREV